ncbi:MAG: hypothetical protein E7Z84_08515 [Methanosphaera stadtmanae]|nr:hypothetical protein [Methanosphaera stadtmanae]
MIELDEKYVLHIPSHKYEDGKLLNITTTSHINDLMDKLNNEGYTSFYKTDVKGYYKTRCFDEILITIFTSKKENKKSPKDIFRQWFKEHNSILKQESWAYEHNGTLFIEKLNLKLVDKNKFIYKGKKYSKEDLMDILSDILEEYEFNLSDWNQDIFVEKCQKSSFPSYYFTDGLLDFDKIIDDKDHLEDIFMNI